MDAPAPALLGFSGVTATEVTAGRMLGHRDPRDGGAVAALSRGSRGAQGCAQRHPTAAPSAGLCLTGRERGSGMQLRRQTELTCPIFVPICQDAARGGNTPFSPLGLLAKAGRLWGRATGWGGRSGPHTQQQHVTYIGWALLGLSPALIAGTSAHNRAVGQP